MTSGLITEPPPKITLRGKRFCFTGEFAHHRRAEYEVLVKAAKGIVWKRVNCSLDYLVVGDGSLADEVEIRDIREHLKVRTALTLIEFGNQDYGPPSRPCPISIVSETHLQLTLGV